ncbi:hypothetical protein G7068_14975 [Leucobacter viscericola]|uniref:DoxX-like family protein n=1 Tax=Leucobacter viscericola TaxID=2714935 RepID=A0A6G7XIM1_9MICO|nr:DoxX family protein [Leucobacter viscericola]QIK64362.1 hypothetical protein G7068_14975 [Leucobacter viscericola]
MILLAQSWWIPAALAFILFADAIISIRPPAFIRACLDGVKLPREWWWMLIVIKLLGTAGLIVGIWVPGIGFAANTGVIVYFVCAAIAHLRAKFLKQEFWVNCLGMLLLSILALVFSYLV